MPIVPSSAGRIHVLQVLGNAIVGGMEHYVMRLIERLPAERFVVSVLCPFESGCTDQLRALGCEVVITPMPDDASWNSVQLASTLVKSNAIDVIHAHLPNAHLLAGLAGKLTGKPVLCTLHGRQLSPVDIEVHRTTGTHLSVVSKPAYFHVLGLGVNAAQLHLLPNGVDTDVFVPQPRSSGPLRQRFGIADDVPLIGFVGRLSAEKGPDVFLRAAVAIRQGCPAARFVLVGEGPMLAQLKAFIAQFELGAAVHLAGVQEDMPRVMNELDLLVSASHSEGMPLALMEAMASGLPVVATSVGGVPDIVQQGITGWLVEDGDFEALAVRAAALLDDPQQRTSMGRRARQRAVERLALSDSVRATMELLLRLSQPRGDQRRIGAVVNDPKPTLNGALAADQSAAA